MISTNWEEFGIKLLKSTQKTKTKQNPPKQKKIRQLLIPVKRELCKKGTVIIVH